MQSNRKLIMSRHHSDFYEEIIDGISYCLKVSSGWMWVDLDTTLKAYGYYNSLENKEGLVEVLDAWKENEKIYILMEYLKEYKTLRLWLTELHPEEEIEEVFLKIFKTLSSLASQRVLNVDCGDGNWMINDNLDIKMIDLDTMITLSGVEEITNIPRMRSFGLGTLDLILKFNKCRRLNAK